MSQKEVSGLPGTFYKHIILCSSGSISCDLEMFPATGREQSYCPNWEHPSLALCWTGREAVSTRPINLANLICHVVLKSSGFCMMPPSVTL